MKKVSAGTIARTVCLLLALTNQILTATGHSIIPIDDDTVQLLVSTIFTVITAIISWWKNNSFTQAAIEADEVMRQLKTKEGE